MSHLAPERQCLKFKDEGNALYSGKRYKEAFQAYSSAISCTTESSTLAILYSNRAACLQQLHLWEKALEVARAATKLNPAFSRAWARLAVAQDALHRYEEAVKSWEQALEQLPKDNLSSSQQKQKEQYQALREQSALQMLEKNEGQPQSGNNEKVDASDLRNSKDAPWARARRLLPELKRQGITDSSALGIITAREFFEKGMALMPTLTAEGWISGRPGALAYIMDALILDHRCHSGITGQQWADAMYRQVQTEMPPEAARYVDLGRVCPSVKEVKKLWNDLRGNWTLFRPAVECLLRTTLLDAFFSSAAKVSSTIEMYDKVLAVQRWGCDKWRDLPTSCKGPLFEEYFIRGVRKLRLDTYIREVHIRGEYANVTVEGILEDAEDLLKEIETNPLELEPRFKDAFELHPKAIALVGKAAYWCKRAEPLKPKEQRELYQLSAECYLRAADVYHKDEEYRIRYLDSALWILLEAGAPLRQTLPIMEDMRTSIPVMKRIWEQEDTMRLGKSRFDNAFRLEESAKKQLADGTATLEDNTNDIYIALFM